MQDSWTTPFLTPPAVPPAAVLTPPPPATPHPKPPCCSPSPLRFPPAPSQPPPPKPHSPRSERPLAVGGALGHLGEFLDHAVALEFRDVVDEQHAVEMVDLMLQRRRQQALGEHFPRLALAVEKARAHLRRPLDLFVIFRDRQAALLVDRPLVGRPEDLGIDEIRGCGGSSFLAMSMTITRIASATWIAARPMPGASYMVSTMSSISSRKPSSTCPSGALTRRSFGSGRMMMWRSAIGRFVFSFRSPLIIARRGAVKPVLLSFDPGRRIG